MHITNRRMAGVLYLSTMEGDAEQTGRQSVSARIIDAVASATETDPLEIEPPLYSAVDTDALDRLAGSDSGAAVQVEFEYADHDIAVDGDGTIAVDGTTYDGSTGQGK